jgi:hypothetical protein
VKGAFVMKMKARGGEWAEAPGIEMERELRW